MNYVMCHNDFEDFWAVFATVPSKFLLKICPNTMSPLPEAVLN